MKFVIFALVFYLVPSDATEPIDDRIKFEDYHFQLPLKETHSYLPPNLISQSPATAQGLEAAEHAYSSAVAAAVAAQHAHAQYVHGNRQNFGKSSRLQTHYSKPGSLDIAPKANVPVIQKPYVKPNKSTVNHNLATLANKKEAIHAESAAGFTNENYENGGFNGAGHGFPPLVNHNLATLANKKQSIDAESAVRGNFGAEVYNSIGYALPPTTNQNLATVGNKKQSIDAVGAAGYTHGNYAGGGYTLVPGYGYSSGLGPMVSFGQYANALGYGHGGYPGVGFGHGYGHGAGLPYPSLGYGLGPRGVGFGYGGRGGYGMPFHGADLGVYGASAGGLGSYGFGAGGIHPGGAYGQAGLGLGGAGGFGGYGTFSHGNAYHG